MAVQAYQLAILASNALGTSAGAATQQTFNDFLATVNSLATDIGSINIGTSQASAQSMEGLTSTAVSAVLGLALGSSAQSAYASAAQAAQTLATDIGGSAASPQITSDMLNLFAEALGEYDVVNGNASTSAYAAIIQATDTVNSDVENSNTNAIAADVTALVHATDAGDVSTSPNSAAWDNLPQSEASLISDLENGVSSSQIPGRFRGPVRHPDRRHRGLSRLTGPDVDSLRDHAEHRCYRHCRWRGRSD